MAIESTSVLNKVENPCFNCGLCCRNIMFCNETKDFVHSFQSSQLIPDRLILSEIFDLAKKDTITSNAYYTPLGAGRFDLIIVGNCEFLTEEKKCSRYETRFDKCKNFEVGSVQCNSIRKNAGLAEISKDGIVLERNYKLQKMSYSSIFSSVKNKIFQFWR